MNKKIIFSKQKKKIIPTTSNHDLRRVDKKKRGIFLPPRPPPNPSDLSKRVLSHAPLSPLDPADTMPTWHVPANIPHVTSPRIFLTWPLHLISSPTCRFRIGHPKFPRVVYYVRPKFGAVYVSPPCSHRRRQSSFSLFQCLFYSHV